MTRQFPHRHAGHCESGTVSALLRDRGLDLSEPMVFGIGGGVFFVYLPYVKMGGIPLIAYRGAPGSIIKLSFKRLGITTRRMRFRDEDKGMTTMDSLLSAGESVGLRTSVFWLPYFPQDMRFQFNAHHLVAYGKQGNDYLISDPVFEFPVTCPSEDLKRCRFSKGLFAPKGFLFYPVNMPPNVDLKAAVRQGIRFTCGRMLGIIPFLGVAGIRFLARHIRKWPDKYGREAALVNVGSVVRMQEEIGTGGGGFRFMYTAFLQEAHQLLGLPAIGEAADMMSDTGDKWRDFAVLGARACKGRETSADVFRELSEQVLALADREEKIFRFLKAAV